MTTPESRSFTSDADGLAISFLCWHPAGAPRAAVQIAHGMAEHKERYARLADVLVGRGLVVYANDHRGHGKSVSDAVPLGDLGDAGWDALLADMVQFGRLIRDENPGVPLFLVGHSMGSMAAQQVLLDRSDRYDGVVLSGTTALDVFASAMPADEPADLTSLNAGFEQRTGFEWLSRDGHEVDLYAADPLCGFPFTARASAGFFLSGGRAGDPAAIAGIRHDLPILVASGEQDPVGANGQLVGLVAQRYRDAGLTDVTMTLYPGARHEIFNETNRDEVMADVADWIEQRIPA
jgi:alpha-beta hydrolase superfamily lysophospholipase